MKKVTKLIINKQSTLNIDDLVTYCNELEIKLKKQKEINKKAIEYIKENLIISSTLDGKKYYCLNEYGFDYKELLQILKDKREV